MRFEDREILTVVRGDQFKTLKLINRFAEEGKAHPFIKSSIKKYGLDKSPASLEKLFNALHRLVYFFPDPKGSQLIRTVNRTLKDQRGNCVDYTVLQSAFLRALGVPHKIRMAEYEGQQDPGLSHIYIQTADGLTMDPVIGQDQHGNEINKAYRKPYFNMERPFIKKFDKTIRA